MSEAVELMKEWAQLHHAHAEAEKVVKALKAKMNELAPDVVVAMSTDGVSKMTFGDLGTVFTQTTIRASAVDHEKLAAELENCGITGIGKMTVNSTTLAAYVREQVKIAGELGETIETPADALPPTVAELITITEIPEIRLRKA